MAEEAESSLDSMGAEDGGMNGENSSSATQNDSKNKTKGPSAVKSKTPTKDEDGGKKLKSSEEGSKKVKHNEEEGKKFKSSEEGSKKVKHNEEEGKKVKSSEEGSKKVKSDEVRSKIMMLGEEVSKKVKSGEEGSKKVKSGEEGSDKVKPGEEDGKKSKPGSEEGSKKMKPSKEKEKGEGSVEASASSSFNSRPNRQRMYRTRLFEYSSSDEEAKPVFELLPESSTEGAVIPDPKADPKLDIPPDSTSDRGDTSADTSRDTETDHMDPTSPSAMETGSAASANTDNDNTDESPSSGAPHLQTIFGGMLSGTDSLDSEDEDATTQQPQRQQRRRRRRNSDSPEEEEEDEAARRRVEEAIEKELRRIKERPKPTHEWNFVDQIVKRQMGGRARHQSSILFTHHYYDSLHVPKRLELMYKMEFHRGCVNALSFNSSGSRLASGSDDFQIAVWDWAREKPIVTFYSGHRNNVFQSKFLPFSDDTHIVSCARDGLVRLAELSSTGVCKDTRKLAKHHGPAHKLATLPTSPHVVLSAGEDAVVLSVDIRQEQPSRVALVKGNSGSRISLYSIHNHPVNEHQFCVSGHDQFVRVYDRRLASRSFPLFKYCPRHLFEATPSPTVTCAVYSSNGDSILASYNDDDIYLFDTTKSEGADAAHRYSGHRNNATVKGVNFFGPGSQYVVSGSDCGNIFFWHRETEAIVQCMPGDENGVVNVLEPHPHIPVLATSGLDDDIKIWVPTCENDPALPNLDNLVKNNLVKREKERNEEFTGLDTQMLMVLWHHIRRTDRRRRRMAEGLDGGGGGGGGGGDAGTGGSSSDESNDSDDSEGHRGVQCATH